MGFVIFASGVAGMAMVQLAVSDGLRFQAGRLKQKTTVKAKKRWPIIGGLPSYHAFGMICPFISVEYKENANLVAA